MFDEDLADDYGYQSFRCPRCGRRDYTDTGVAECCSCGWSNLPSAQCDVCQQRYPAGDLIDFGGKMHCAECLMVIQEEALEEEAIPEPGEEVAQ